MNLHDWIDELSDVLDLETEVDEGLLSDLAELAHDKVDPGAGPVTAYLLGYAAGANDAGPAAIERLASRAQTLAEGWDRPAGALDPDDPADLDEEILDDGSIAEIVEDDDDEDEYVDEDSRTG